jgi:hypothetical protein
MIPLEHNLSPDVVHSRVREAHKVRRGAERVLAFYLLEINERRLYQTLGYESIYHYAKEVADLTTRQTRELLRVAEALENLPLLAKAYSSAFLPWSTVREISRVATPKTEKAWIEEASRLSWWVARGRWGWRSGSARRLRAGLKTGPSARG